MTDEIKLILGTMTFGPQVDIEGSRAMIECFTEAGYNELDTAYVYNDGETEKILGDILKEFKNHSLSIATKVHPRITGKLDGFAVAMQFEESLRRMGRDSVDILYFHLPDPKTPIEGALEVCANLYKKGKFKELGLSNYPANMVIDILHLCKKNGWPRPTVYQGMYNAFTRSVEGELFSVLREHGMRFYAFNPLAGGLLTGKHKNYGNNPTSGRFARLQSYRNRYWKESYFEAVDIITTACLETRMEPAEAALRWLAYNSFLDTSKGDGVIIGASSVKQLEQNLLAVKKGSLPAVVLNAFSNAWEKAKPECPPYFQYYKG